MKHQIIFNIKAATAVISCLFLAGLFGASFASAQTPETNASTSVTNSGGGGYSTPAANRLVCTIGKQMYRIGTVRSSITSEKFRTQHNRNVRFVCQAKDGKATWVKTKLRPVKPTNPVCIKGKSGYDGSGRPGTAECLGNEPVKPASTTPPLATTYSLADVTSVTKEYVDPNKAIADEEYNLYVITLKTGKTIEVKVPVRTMPGTAEEAFRKTGYTGNVTELQARATEVAKGTASTTSAAPRVTLVAGNDQLVNATVVVARTLRPVVVTGPTTLGTIAWGDDSTESLVGLNTGNEMIVKISHRYKTAGTYTVTVTDPNGKVTKTSISVKAGATATTTPIRATMPSNGSVRGAATDVYQNIASVLVSLKQLLDTFEAR